MPRGVQKNLNAAVVRRVESLCRQKGWTYRRLATEAGVSSRTIHEMMKKGTSDKGYISLTTVKKVADAFEMGLADFFATTYFEHLPRE